MGVNPRPRSKPGPPLFFATTTPATVSFAAANRLPLLHYWSTPLEARMATERLYAEAATDSPVDHVHALVAVVTDDEASARRTLAERLRQSFRDGWPHVPQASASGRHVGPDGQPVARDKLADFVAQRASSGRPTASSGLQNMQTKLGARRFVLFMEAVAEREAILSSIERFAREVMPRLVSTSNPVDRQSTKSG